MTRKVLCAHCAGNGRLRGGSCFHCKGSGEIPARVGHTLRIHHDAAWDGVRSDCSCGEYIGFVAGELFHTLPTLAGREQSCMIDQWKLHRPKPHFDPPTECTIALEGGPKDGAKITIPWQTYRRGVLVVSGPVSLSPALFTQHAEKEHIYTAEQRHYIYMPDWRNPLIWSC